MSITKKAFFTAFILAVLISGAAMIDLFVLNRRGMDRLRAHHLLRRELWSIGLVEGDRPLSLHEREGNPILRARDITDTAARMVADPFAVEKDGIWYLFFEIDSVSTRQGEIGLATSSDLESWEYRQIILDEPFHLSYPQVFEWEGVFYMIPESHLANAVRLYRAERFPDQWAYVGDLVSGPHKDPSIFRYQNRWWLFTCTGQNENMNLFYADELSGPWIAHAENPVVQTNRSIARPGGRIQMIDGHPMRFAQDCLNRYGHKVLAFQIEELTPSGYRETPVPENPILEPDGSGWNARRMHHLDLHKLDSRKWIGFTDGHPY